MVDATQKMIDAKKLIQYRSLLVPMHRSMSELTMIPKQVNSWKLTVKIPRYCTVASSDSHAGIVVVRQLAGIPTSTLQMNRYTQWTGIMVSTFRVAAAADAIMDTFFRPNRSMKYVTDMEPTMEPMRTATESSEVITDEFGSNGVTCEFWLYILMICVDRFDMELPKLLPAQKSTSSRIIRGIMCWFEVVAHFLLTRTPWRALVSRTIAVN